MRIAVDLMGADTPPEVLLKAVLTIIPQFPSFSFDIYVPHGIHAQNSSQITFIPCDQAVMMDEDPIAAVRAKPRSSLVLALSSIQEGMAHGLLTCCNTGALLVASTTYLTKLPHVRRPALVAEIALSADPVFLLDVGATAGRSAQQMAAWAWLGAAYAQARGVNVPRIGLLNIGVEAKKGALEHQQVLSLLSAQMPQFIGNIEPRMILEGAVDVVITDGFAGNILLKSFEAMSLYWLNQIPEGPVREEISKKIDFSMNRGALLVGLDSYVMKCHGSASPAVFSQALQQLLKMVGDDLLRSLKSCLNAL